MGIPAATLEAAAQAVADLGDRISMHTGDPGTTGANEATGGGYSRQTTTWSAGGSDGTITGSQVTVPVAAGTYTHFGVWSSGGTFRGGKALPGGSVVMGSAGNIKFTPTVSAAAA